MKTLKRFGVLLIALLTFPLFVALQVIAFLMLRYLGIHIGLLHYHLKK
jgi:hypothetical protein